MEDKVVVFLGCCFSFGDDGEVGFEGFSEDGDGVCGEGSCVGV
jgi:hypothetical protein